MFQDMDDISPSLPPSHTHTFWHLSLNNLTAAAAAKNNMVNRPCYCPHASAHGSHCYPREFPCFTINFTQPAFPAFLLSDDPGGGHTWMHPPRARPAPDHHTDSWLRVLIMGFLSTWPIKHGCWQLGRAGSPDGMKSLCPTHRAKVCA